jgi:C-terminal processing protease CtpA/Prc
MIEYQWDGDQMEANVLPVSKGLVDASIDSLYAPGGSRSPELHLSLLEKQTALLRIGSFAYYDDNKGFNSFIDSSFRVIRDRHIQHLVIDLRGNDGGDPFCSSHLLSYLQREPVIYFRERYGQYARLSQPLPMAELPFAGDQYYLINGVCFSTTGHFASLLKYHNLGTFIGEETGGTFTCNDASHDVSLKHTGYRVQSARRSFSAAAYGFPVNRGILPDHHVQPSIEEQICHKDAVLEYTLKLIRAL